jgi:ABC-type uncharacterized transport system ATPase component
MAHVYIDLERVGIQTVNVLSQFKSELLSLIKMMSAFVGVAGDFAAGKTSLLDILRGKVNTGKR